MANVQRDPSDGEDFEAAAMRTIEQHIRNSFVHTYKPVLDDAEYRSFDRMKGIDARARKIYRSG